MDIQRIGVVGGGLMGSGIAEICARAGLDVTLREVNEQALEGAQQRVERSLERATRSKKIEPGAGEEALGRIRWVTDYEELADRQLVVEAVIEDESAKEGVFSILGRVVTDETAILASNTSSIPIMKLAMASGRPQAVIGMHFFNPVPVLRLLELVPTALLIPYLLSSIRMLESGFATTEDIDSGMVEGCNHPMGPLALADLIGLDTLAAVAQSLYEEFKEPLYASPPLLSRMVEAGLLGRKTRRGFHDYAR
jgi:3-hydroxybutyryl-CoA dehydrogenase